MAVPPPFRMVRAEDQLVVDVALVGMTISPPPATGGRVHQLHLVDAGVAGRMTLTFESQQIIEYARDPQGELLFQSKPIFAPPSTVVLTVPAGTPPAAATVAGVLDLARRLPLVTDPRAGTATAQRRPAPEPRVPAARAIAARRDAITGRTAAGRRRAEAEDRRRPALPPAVTATPGADHAGTAVGATATTSFALPYRLVIKPPGGDTRLDHATRAVGTGAGRPLWTTSLGVTDGQRTTETTLPVIFGATPLPGSPGVEWIDVVDDAKIDNAFDSGIAEALAEQTDPPKPAGSPPNAPLPPIDPARLRRLRLSSLGGWLRLAGRWPTKTIKKYAHDVAMGRDQSQLVVKQGILFPFGFKVTATSETTRVLERGSTRLAALHTVDSLTVDDPFAEFGTFVDQPGWPYREITCRTVETGPGTLVAATLNGNETVDGVEVFTRNGRPMEYDLVAVDRMGQEVHFQLPMLFVPLNRIGNTGLPALWAGQGTVYTDLDLGGQPHGMAPESTADEAADLVAPASRQAARAAAVQAARATAELPTPAGATTVLARTLRFSVDATGRAATTYVKGIAPSLDKVLPGQELVLGYAAAYLSDTFGAGNPGKAFLQLTTETANQQIVRPVVGLGKQLAGQAAGSAAALTGGLVSTALPIAALSRKYGAVAGAVESIAAGKLDLNSIIDVGDKLLGLLPLRDMFAKVAGGLLKSIDITDDNYKVTTDVQDGIATMDVTFVTPLFGGPKDDLSAGISGFALLQPLRPPKDDGTPDLSFDNVAKLTVKQHTETDLDGNVRSRNETTVEMVQLVVLFDGKPVVTVPFRRATFVTVDGKKPDPDIDLDKIRFGGILELLARLAEIIDAKGFNDPPALVVTDQGVTSSFSIAAPSLAIGMFALENISFGAALSLAFAPQPEQPSITLDLTFGTPDNPFRVAVAMLGGGGSLGVGLSSRGLESINGVLEFGASVSVDLVIARAKAEVMGGISFLYQRQPLVGRLTAFLRIHGEVEILCLISVCVDLIMALEYQFSEPDAGKLTGTASVAVEIKTIFFSETVTATARQRFAGSNGDPTFAELMAPAGFPGERPWNLYCAAFED